MIRIVKYKYNNNKKKLYIIVDFRGKRISQMKQTPKHSKASLQTRNEDWFLYGAL